MITTGLLISLDSSYADVIQRLRDHPAVTVGEVVDCWLPVAVVAEDNVSCREHHDWISAQQGVVFVDVVHVNFEEPDAEPKPQTSYDPTT